MKVTVDARMIASSGIGRVVGHILAGVIPARPEWQFSLIGPVDKLRAFSFSQLPNCRLIACDCPIYTIREQWLMPRLIPRDTDVY